ncbi:MAG: bifunctional folylpolyglutamate synthase/dihydrofolate synthase [Sulfurimonas sp.]|jgi:dihydrofolate synthase/folylpolyglutamate synthase|nr:bifunctional folylpolyglutamate synthase/dihydrofolate synthase [Sulfurimonas sp.]
MIHQFLEQKPLFYAEIDTTRMPRIYEKVKTFLGTPKIIHIIGTNGKGTTGRFLASALHKKGLDVGHYTSPHILHFNERIWRNGVDVSDRALEDAHTKLQEILSEQESQSLSYFEYTTLLAMFVFAACDYVVLEAGLGGEFDATAVFENILTLVTPIDIDHQSFLGETLQEIASTKLRAMQKSCILAEQKFSEVYTIAQDIAQERGCKLFSVQECLKQSDKETIEQIAQELKLPSYLRENLKLSISALLFLGFEYSLQDFTDARLFGRMSSLAENIIVDVGHNPLAARSIKEALVGEKYTLIYNTYKDKDYKEILTILSPIIESVEILDVEEPRIVAREQLERCLSELKIKYKHFDAARFQKECQDRAKKYLVFGSFSVVEKFLKVGMRL